MCGISAVIDRTRSADAVGTLLRMHAPIRHRGPDDERFLIVDGDWRPRVFTAPQAVPRVPIIAGLAFRRLRILDLSDAAAQPMASADGRIWICFNGEIYNHQTLRNRLVAYGFTFRSHSDTEVALAAYQKWGSGCFEELDGMWAIVIVDLAERKVVASRDRFGIKPLQWADDGSTLLLASESKQILAARGERARAHAPLVASYLRGNRIPALDESFFRGLNPFPTATCAEISLTDGGSMQPRKFWDLASIAPASLSPSDYGATVDRFEGVLRDALRTHNVADVRVGYLLSGGLDSSMLTALMADQARKSETAPAPTFSFGFRERAPQFCELRYADAVAKKYDLVLHETTLSGRWIADNAGRVMCAVEEPVLGTPALAQFRLFEFCRQRGMTVVVDGEASDEVLAGYSSYQLNLLRHYLRSGRLIAFRRELSAMARNEERSSLSLMSEIVRRRFQRRAPYDWMRPDYGRRSAEDALQVARALADHGGNASPVGRLLFRDVKWGNVKIVLHYTDRVSMAHSIEARVPYLDLSLVTMAFALPDEFKVGNGERKRILRDVARRYLPVEVTERKDRMGFGMPDALLFDEIWSDIEGRTLAISAAPPFQPGAVERFVRDYRAGRHADTRALWRIYALARWAEEFDVTLD